MLKENALEFPSELTFLNLMVLGDHYVKEKLLKSCF